MKTTLRTALAFFLILVANHADAQNSCVSIDKSSLRIISGQQDLCQRSISFSYSNPTNNEKSIKVIATSGKTEVYNGCIDASGQKDVVRNFTSPYFLACNLGDLVVTITPMNGSDCTGRGCDAITISSGGSLPVTYSYFKATRNNDMVLLDWETVTEINNTGFTIERNTDGNWQPVGFVATKAMNGNSQEKIAYQFADHYFSKAISQYRLLQTDIDGKSKYSEIRVVRGTDQEANINVYPNPSADGTVNIMFADASLRTIILTDMAGRTVKQWNSYNNNSLRVTGLSTGMFTLRISNLENGNGSTQKIVVTGK